MSTLRGKAISSAPEARCLARGFRFGGRGETLSRRRGTLEFVAEVLKVFLADLQLQHFFNHRREVRQRPDRSERRGAGGPYEPPCRSQYKGVLNRVQRHAALVQLGRQHPVGTANDTARARSHTVGVQKPAHIVALLHELSPAVRATRDP